MSFNTKRTEDSRLNDCVTEYLDRTIYPQIPIFRKWQRYTDKDTQLSGIDIVFDINGFPLICDEKSAVQWAGQYPNGTPKLTSFILEISPRTSKDCIIDGWFLNPLLKTEYYNFIWIPVVKNNKFKQTSDIIQLDIALIKKSDIELFLATRGWSREKLHRKADRIRFENDTNLGPFNDVQFTFSKQLAEEPINIKLQKSKYIQLATAYYSFKNGILQPGFIERFK